MCAGKVRPCLIIYHTYIVYYVPIYSFWLILSFGITMPSTKPCQERIELLEEWRCGVFMSVAGVLS